MQFVRIYLFIVIFSSSLYSNVIGQEDTINRMHERNFIRLADTTFLAKFDTVTELWFKDKSLDTWQLNNETEVFTYDKGMLRAWRQKSMLSLWFYAKRINDWHKYDTKELKKVSVNDSVYFSLIDDTTKLVSINNKKHICYFTQDTYLWEMQNSPSFNQLNDTTSFFRINDTLNLWKSNDSTVLWFLNRNPKLWKLNHTTLVWTIDNYTEFWQTGSKYRIWRRKTLFDEWEKDIAVKPRNIGKEKQYWTVNDSVMICIKPDTVQIWKAGKNKKHWKVNDSTFIWTYRKIVLDTISEDTIKPQIRKVKEAILWNLNNSIKIWNINDSTKLYTSEGKEELWKKNNIAKLWKLSDSTIIWNIDENTKVSMISDSLTIWLRNDSTFTWDIDSIKTPFRVSDTVQILGINDSTMFSRIKDSTTIWNSSKSVKLANKSKTNNFLILNDTTEIWEPNDSTKLWIDKFGETGKIWEQNKRVNILNINDSTKVWQLNENVRLTIINGKLKIWQQGVGDPYLSWKESRGFRQENIRDSINIWHIDKNSLIWESKQKIEVWNKKDSLELFRLNDTSLVWTFNTALIPPKTLKPKFWTLSGAGKMDVAQVWIEQWAKGGENSLSTLFILNYQANYKKKKVKWDNDFEYRYGFLKQGEQALRKNEDKIKINSIFNYYAFKKVYYGFTTSLQTQFFKGYRYKPDTAVVSNWAAPLYMTNALGLNYFPVKQLSVFFSPITNRTIFVRDTSVIDQTNYGVERGQKVKYEPGAIVKSILNWNITKNIHLLNKFDLFTRYDDLKKYNVDWELTLTFKFNSIVHTTLNTHLVYDPDFKTTDSQGNEKNPVQFKEVLSIGLFYKI